MKRRTIIFFNEKALYSAKSWFLERTSILSDKIKIILNIPRKSLKCIVRSIEETKIECNYDKRKNEIRPIEIQINDHRTNTNRRPYLN